MDAHSNTHRNQLFYSKNFAFKIAVERIPEPIFIFDTYRNLLINHIISQHYPWWDKSRGFMHNESWRTDHNRLIIR
ncbi:MAG: hypothetical protein DI558_06170 [Corynebacterium propinquum]|nr:MAG: hypothetical protein DI558_06170 [Corynebacterium propinquum]